MDTLTHIALGASIGTALLGRRIGVRNAAFTGAVLANLPDLDVFWPFDDPVDKFVHHRGPTHSWVMQALAAPFFGEALLRLAGPLREGRLLTYLSMFLCMASHSLLDYFTIYGTQIFWPISREALASGAIFVIDPLYTLPLLVPLFWAFIGGRWSPAFRRALAGGLALSSLYMVWVHGAQLWAEARAKAELAKAGITAHAVLATPMPLNSLLWNAIALDGERSYTLYIPVLGGSEGAAIYAHERNLDLGACLPAGGPAQILSDFAHGYFRYQMIDDGLVWSDLRMGLAPNHSFRFIVARQQGDALIPVPAQRLRGPRAADGDIDWLLASVRGDKLVRPVESAQLLNGRAPPAPAPAKRRC